ncbi:hypothetical protein [Halobacteriovorax sp. HLS]|uniref:hypothetical protein n=1 Tax=Halobacteriovorax sp. HLS TaxID=2234000 RepID=UPI000FD9DC8F|nr:hypothetical protein [Halobacteriovorax sp. HLS]
MLKNLIIFNTLLLLSSCSKEAPKEIEYDSSGRIIEECSIRNADGRGPYHSIGRTHEIECIRKISKLCNESRYKQVHKTKGHFARGKFGTRITIGTCP